MGQKKLVAQLKHWNYGSKGF